MHRTTKHFWRCFDELPEAVQRAARESFELLRADRRHPSLHFKKVGNFWSARVLSSGFGSAAMMSIYELFVVEQFDALSPIFRRRQLAVNEQELSLAGG